MPKYLNYLLTFLLLCQTSFVVGQRRLDGYYVKLDTNFNSNGTTQSVRQASFLIKNDSIWYETKSFNSKNLRLDTGFSLCKGTFRKYKDEFIAFLMVMECDTCPKFWKYTTKTEDSIGVEVMKLSNDIDTIIKNGDTTILTYEAMSDKAGNVDVDRIREYFFKQPRPGEILLFDKILFRRRKQTSQ